MKLSNLLSISLISLSLAACGGGSDSKDSSGNTGNSNPSSGNNNSYVAGAFKNSIDTGEYYVKSNPNGLVEQEFGSMARDCVSTNNDYYFETERTMVFGSQSVDQDDFKKVATKVENNLDAALSSMGTNFTAFMGERLSIAKYAVNQTITGMELMDFHGKPENFDDIDFPKKEWSFMYFNSMNNADKLAFAIEASKELGNEYTKDQILYKEKVYVCIKESSSNTSLGEGNKYGLALAVPGFLNSDSPDNLVKHELIHTVQLGLVHSLRGNILPKWFVEGQAMYLAGQTIAIQSSHHDVTVPDFVSSFDEGGTDMGEQYRHYGMAYKYLQDSNGNKKMVDLLRAINDGDHIYYPKQLPVEYNFNYGAMSKEDTAFIVAFDDMLMLKKNGQPLSMNDWKTNYHSVMN